ncbi:hypothetical protein JYT16_00835 [Gemmatimonas aurantiaca]|nr:hypothetical protein [Gemmatimonas aurantiaca]
MENGNKNNPIDAAATISETPRIAVEFSDKVAFRAIKGADGEFYPEGSDIVCNGSVLSVSADGLIVDTSELMPEGTLVSVDLELSSGASAPNALGKIERVDQVDGQMVIGISFLKMSSLKDILATAELELLDERFVEMRMAVDAALKTPSASGQADTPNDKVGERKIS